eukprot:TRINITY_DN7022_c0_g1_i2.p1 TRINITY_DN7022_c0_g1~~TRINITY_DN7022_c0_g1_i2.p1  ORF type:complete len:185 (+),score=42.85 TRINITY_DN7022_c0_g1_i2:42-596(+)
MGEYGETTVDVANAAPPAVDDLREFIQQNGILLSQAWEKEERVETLKIAMNCAKLLGDTGKLGQDYPGYWELIAQIFDNFGDMVFQRIKEISAIHDKPLKVDFKEEDVSEHAKYTISNWFYKIAAIRELLPRIYMELALVKSYQFLDNNSFSKALIRLDKMMNGLGNPLVAQYARLYLQRKATL